MMELEKLLLNRDKRAIARAITYAEDDEEKAREIIRKLYKRSGNAYIVGITGPPGVGKSTLTDRLVKNLVEEGKKIGIIAVDPTSPFTGGSILGDRIRMQDLTTHPNVYIRSMGTRGHLGGLSKGTYMAVRILDIAGMDYVFVETVGVGQSEVDIIKIADTVVMVLAPGLGDDIQAIKAGIMEIADVFVVNKSDREGADKTVLELNMMLDLDMPKEWRPPVVKAVAQEGKGIGEVLEKIHSHKEYLISSGQLEERRKNRIKMEITESVKNKLMKDVFAKMGNEEFDQKIQKVMAKEIDPYTVAEALYRQILERRE
ncbi:MAG: Putative periplasmic protein kinase ArgK [Caldanaerobacter subterraneus]|jgi:LAO/AO transport system kinase|uniref:Periplasmic protein kinase ArgK and related GTPases of G3E family n=2 Tax=Caldanaerobacter subterraneus TaxID=911092 RepID=Q8R7L6_CALS4|nr:MULTISPECIES: methylmalonyl Co-A mutase-associated GTPase MeaB [Caldanaerobacter]AAM25526.1 putative periplasmic protein kinase ArgK and related GTPases of G3E family [Caldanaerobacter subterraneus subsp. tengcongensis MB4]KUK08799.1 MAG: Putative periplasmic protein kinase ArgK [Caldanaerobacter subterraneus]MCS3914863.1 LAO/AO transport system kinase [Caldanaerobacter subterraneus subsp. tengcongensis MB4]MDI3519326.1 GTPase [Caldanaerobacter sp.]MDK2794716.1 GTPase [Caldanaerobacter sp.]